MDERKNENNDEGRKIPKKRICHNANDEDHEQRETPIKNAKVAILQIEQEYKLNINANKMAKIVIENVEHLLKESKNIQQQIENEIKGWQTFRDHFNIDK